MSFVVEIPTVFTKPTQIPARLGNTILTGNETIEGSLSVNGSLTLNNGNEGDSTNVVNYDSLDISNNLNVNGLTTLNEVNASSITTNNLVVNESLNINNVITYEKYKQFDTLVMRREDEDDTRALNPNEIQVFVNNDNILFPNPAGMTSYFAVWSAKFTPIASASGGGTELVYNNSVQFGAESLSAGGANALIINNITPTFVDEIQAIVFYHRANAGTTGLTTGLIFELYNSVDDADLLVPLAVTPIITTANYLHRYDFPAITTYTNGFFSTTYQSTTQIPDIGKGQQSTATINDIDTDIHINSNVDISGTITLPIIGDVKTSIQGNTDNILTNTNNLSGVQTQVDALINFTGGGVNFRAYSLSSVTINAGNNLTYDNEDYDTENSYDTSNNIYTIVISGTYVFSFGWYVVSGSTAVINLIRKRNSVETILQQSTNGTNTGNNSGFFSTTIAECETNDEIYAYLDSGSCRLIPYGISDPDTFTSFSGSRISN